MAEDTITIEEFRLQAERASWVHAMRRYTRIDLTRDDAPLAILDLAAAERDLARGAVAADDTAELPAIAPGASA